MSVDESYRKFLIRKHLSDAFAVQSGLKQGENKERVSAIVLKLL
jgi:hypothetical protein